MGVQVPELMRGYMYAVGHGRPAARPARAPGVGPVRHPLHDVHGLPVRCALGFDVRARARDLARLLDA